MVEPATPDNTPEAKTPPPNPDAPKDAKKPTPVVLEKDTYRLRQTPLVQGAVVALDPNTGRVLAMQGGWKSDGNGFNRATQAKRQPGSAFKPFVYLAALDKGFTPSSIIMDTPITFTDTAGNVWRPENYHGDYLGPTPLRGGVEKSRDLMTIHLAQQIGIKTIVEYANRFGIDDSMPANLSNVLGAEVHLVRPPLPDLVDTILSAPAAVAMGQPFSVVYKITNIGSAVPFPGAWRNDLYFSADFQLQVGDRLLSGKTRTTPLAPGASFIDTVTCTMPLN